MGSILRGIENRKGRIKIVSNCENVELLEKVNKKHHNASYRKTCERREMYESR